ncbi:hypothetical protein BCD95_005452 [Clostridium beijerinckii]|uniref:DUF4280 domain-containing protein n=1 Tax=Clostridium beijerinckii TaxID=1520 RepID=A0AAE5LSJ1_CLOBE|nr:hypothetical protein [Clostridium beijerinckii]
MGDWIRCEEDTIVEGKQALTIKSVLACAYGGKITFVTDGQND